MKLYYLIITLLIISCGQGSKEKKEPETNMQDAVEAATDIPPKENHVASDTINEEIKIKEPSVTDTTNFGYLKEENKVHFDAIIKAIKTKVLPVIDTTNYANSEEEDLYDKPEVAVLKLEKIYPNFYKNTHNYKAKASYKIEYSNNFHSVVITIFKGENEMESRLINYDLQGNIIDSKVISYDEMAEGMFMITSKIEHDRITVDNIKWIEEKEVATTLFEIKPNGLILEKK